MSLIPILIKLANILDQHGIYTVANQIDAFISKYATEEYSLEHLKKLFNQLIYLQDKDERTETEEKRLQEISNILKAVKKLPTPPSLIQKMHLDPPLPTHQPKPGDKKYLVYDKDYIPYIGTGGIGFVSVYAQNETEAKEKGAKQMLGRHRKLDEIEASPETEEHKAFHKKREQEMNKAFEQHKKETQRKNALEQAKKELHFAEMKGKDDRTYPYHMKEFARYMKEAAETSEDLAKYRAMELEFSVLWENRPKLSVEERKQQVEQILKDLERIQQGYPSFSPKLPDKNN